MGNSITIWAYLSICVMIQKKDVRNNEAHPFSFPFKSKYRVLFYSFVDYDMTKIAKENQSKSCK